MIPEGGSVVHFMIYCHTSERVLLLADELLKVSLSRATDRACDVWCLSSLGYMCMFTPRKDVIVLTWFSYTLFSLETDFKRTKSIKRKIN